MKRKCMNRHGGAEGLFGRFRAVRSMALANRPDGCGSCHGFGLGLVQKMRLPLFGPLNPLGRKKCGETEAHSSTSPTPRERGREQ